MNQESKKTATVKVRPKKRCYSNDYIASTALFLIDGDTYTEAHFYLMDQIDKIRSEEDAKKPLTYSEMAEWACKLVKIYEEDGGE